MKRQRIEKIITHTHIYTWYWKRYNRLLVTLKRPWWRGQGREVKVVHQVKVMVSQLSIAMTVNQCNVRQWSWQYILQCVDFHPTHGRLLHGTNAVQFIIRSSSRRSVFFGLISREQAADDRRENMAAARNRPITGHRQNPTSSQDRGYQSSADCFESVLLAIVVRIAIFEIVLISKQQRIIIIEYL